ncbi:EMB2654 [Symbiodinium sp. CCMP2456]|nr:EMB2654 [Symbiodinium sp. CCMP2456]
MTRPGVRMHGAQHGLVKVRELQTWSESLHVLHNLSRNVVQTHLVLYNTAFSKLRSLTSWCKAVLLLESMEHMTMERSLVSFNALVRSFALAGWLWSLHILDLMSRGFVKADVITCNTAISSVDTEHDWPRALSVLDKYQNHCVQTDCTTWNSVFSVVSKGTWQPAVSMVRSMGLEPNVVTFNTALAASDRDDAVHENRRDVHQGWPAALHIRASIPDGMSTEIITEVTVLSVCGKQLQWQIAANLFSSLSLAALEPNIVGCNAMVFAYGQTCRWRDAVAMVETAGGGFRPNTVTFNSAVGSCEKAAEWELATVWIEEMRRGHLQPTTMSCNAAISACEKSSRWQISLELLADVWSKRCNMDTITINAVMSSCAKASWQQALRGLSLAASLWLQVNVISMNAAITSCDTGHLWRGALAILQHFENVKLEPDVISYNSAISACGRCARWPEALWLLSMIPTNRASLISYSAAASACGRGEQWQRALSLLELAMHQRISATSVVFCACMNACERGDQWHRALALLGLMKHRTVEANTIVINSAVSACEKGKHWQHSIALLRELEHGDLQGDIMTYSAVLSACESRFCWRIALAVFAEMKHMECDTPVYNSIMAACIASGQWSHVMGLLMEMEQGRIQASALTQATAISACERGQHLSGACQLISSFELGDLLGSGASRGKKSQFRAVVLCHACKFPGCPPLCQKRPARATRSNRRVSARQDPILFWDGAASAVA